MLINKMTEVAVVEYGDMTCLEIEGRKDNNGERVKIIHHLSNKEKIQLAKTLLESAKI
jgi:hypothetical protein